MSLIHQPPIERTTDPYLKAVLHYLVSQHDENQVQSTKELLEELIRPAAKTVW